MKNLLAHISVALLLATISYAAFVQAQPAPRRSQSSSAAATAKFPTACRSCRAGITWCGSIARTLRF